MKMAIVFGGIGGNFGVSLMPGHREIDIYEPSSDVRALIVGINVLPHASRALDELRLLGQLSGAGIVTADLSYSSRLGQRIYDEPLGIAAGYHWPQVSIHRGDCSVSCIGRSRLVAAVKAAGQSGLGSQA